MSYKISSTGWTRSIIFLAILRVAMNLLMFLDIPRLDYHYRWSFYHGGDDALYFRVGQLLAEGQRYSGLLSVGIGWPWVMSFGIKLLNAVDYDGVLPFLVIINGFVLGISSVWVIAQLTRVATNDSLQSVIVAAVWTLSPYILWLMFLPFPKVVALQNVYVPRQLWLNGLLDAPSIYLTLVGFVFALSAHLTSRDSRRRWLAFALAGVCLGFGAAIRIHILAMIIPLILALLWGREWRGVGLVAVGGVFGFMPQLIYNASSTSQSFLDTPYISNWLHLNPDGSFFFDYRQMPFAPQFFLNNLTMIVRGNLLLAALGAVAVAAVCYAFVLCWRQRGGVVAIALFGAPAGTFIVHATTYMFVEDMIRFSMPALTIGLPAIVWTLFAIGSLLKTGLTRFRF